MSNNPQFTTLNYTGFNKPAALVFQPGTNADVAYVVNAGCVGSGGLDCLGDSPLTRISGLRGAIQSYSNFSRSIIFKPLQLLFAANNGDKAYLSQADSNVLRILTGLQTPPLSIETVTLQDTFAAPVNPYLMLLDPRDNNAIYILSFVRIAKLTNLDTTPVFTVLINNLLTPGIKRPWVGNFDPESDGNIMYIGDFDCTDLTGTECTPFSRVNNLATTPVVEKINEPQLLGHKITTLIVKSQNEAYITSIKDGISYAFEITNLASNAPTFTQVTTTIPKLPLATALFGVNTSAIPYDVAVP